MAWYLNLNDLHETGRPKNTWWVHYYNPGSEVPISGIYKCRHCKKEITSNKGDPFPPQNHHQHATNLGSIQWELIVRTNTEGN